jgi:hypothetical protein
VTFCVVSSLWMLQQVLQASSTVVELSISANELSALREDFSRYDPDLCGDISSNDIGPLLQVIM